jgi:uncharacterized protein YkwD
MPEHLDVLNGATVFGGFLAVLLVLSTAGTGLAPLDTAVDRTQQAAASALSGFGVAGTTDRVDAPQSYNETLIEREIHRQINQRRAANDQPTMAWDDRLHRIADFHSEDMAEQGYIAHEAPDGERMVDRYDRFEYDCRVETSNAVLTGGENLLRLSVTDAAVTERGVAARAVRNWMDSDRHRSTIFTTGWENQAIGVAVDRRSDRTVVYITQNFC